MRYKTIFFLLALLAVIPLAQPLTYHPAHPLVTLLSQDPDPVEPGQVVTVKFKVENEGEATTEDVIVKILPKFPFTIYNDVTEKNIGKIRAEQTGADAAIVEFRLKVDEKAVEEDAEIELLLKVADEAWVSYIDNEFLISIQTHDAVLDIVKIVSEPEQIPPGGTATISIMVKNLADSLLKDIRFKLRLDSSALPLAPYQSSSERRIAQLKTNYQNSLSFQLIADPDAEAGLHKIPLNITYNDEKGNTYKIEDTLAVIVGEKPIVKPYLKKSTSLQANKPAVLTLELANPGTTDVRFLEAYLLPSDDYQLISTSDYFYIGDLDSDDTESEEIEIFVGRGLETLKFPVKLKYYGVDNQQYQQQFELQLKLYSSYKLRKFGLIAYSYTWIIAGAILAAGGLLYLYRKKKRR